MSYMKESLIFEKRQRLNLTNSITDEQEKEARENINKCNREKRKKERERLELD